MKLFGLLVISCITISVAGCQKPVHDPLDDLGRPDNGDDSSKVLPDNVDFEVIYSEVISNYCLSCHTDNNPSGKVSLESYESLFGEGPLKSVVKSTVNASVLYTSLIESGHKQMPPQNKKQLSSDQIELVRLWIENGAIEKNNPNNGSITEPAKPRPRGPTILARLTPYFNNPETIDYRIIDKEIVQNTCFKCHSKSSPDADPTVIAYSANFTNYGGVFSRFNPVVVKGDPIESKFFQSVSMTQSMPPIKDGYQPLNSLLVKLLRLWILNCAIEDYSKLEPEKLHQDPENPDKRRICNAG